MCLFLQVIFCCKSSNLQDDLFESGSLVASLFFFPYHNRNDLSTQTKRGNKKEVL